MIKKHNAGFSLMEIAIVVVLISLLAGGFTVGQSMIRASQMRNAMGDVAKYTQAFNNFLAQYKSPPGDLLTAQNYWGIDPAGCTNPQSSTAAAHTTTCNGNGDGHIGSGSITPGGAQDYEVFRAWQQLSASGYLNGSTTSVFTGISGTGSTLGAIIGKNVPAASIPGGGWTIMFQNVAAAGDGDHYGYLLHHVLFLGSVATNSFTYGPLLTPAEALSIDGKLDDGLPGSGTVQAIKSQSNCSTNSTTYKTSYTGAACGLMFVTNF